MIDTELLRLALVGAAFAAIFLLAELWYRLAKPPVEWTRKAVHTGCGIIIACFHWIFNSDWPVLVLGLGIASGMWAARRFRFFPSIYGVERRSHGDLYFIASALFLYVISHESPVFYFIAMLTLTLSDALAAVIGSTYQKVTYSVEHHYKSIEGSAIFFLSTFLIVHIPLLLMTGSDRLASVLIGIQVSLIVTCLEAICLNGIDNIFVPVGTYYLLTKFQSLPSQTIIDLLLWQFAILLMTNLIAWKLRVLTVSGAIAFQLFLFGAFTLGDPTWLVAPLIALACLIAAYYTFHRSIGTLDFKIWQVVAVFYLTLVPALLVIAHNLFVNHVHEGALAGKHGFYALYAGAIASQMAISLFRMAFLYSKQKRNALRLLLIATAVSIAAILPLALWIQTGTLHTTDLIAALATALIGPAAYGILSARHDVTAARIGVIPPRFPLHFPWEFRIQALSTFLGALISLPLYLWMMQ